MAIVPCARCGAPVKVFPGRAHRTPYCSQACYQASRPKDIEIAVECATCGSVFNRRLSMIRCATQYCSMECSNQPFGEARRTVCDGCGVTFYRKPFKKRGKRYRFCSVTCRTAHQPKGSDSPRWRGGHEKSRGASWKTQSHLARERDNHTCQKCGHTPRAPERQIPVHHVIPFGRFGIERHEEANALDNLVCLCDPCHSRLEQLGRCAPQLPLWFGL